jgi:uncharacterized protein (TIGR02145 family)
MKAFFITFFALCIYIMATAQTTDVVYLKNGSVIKAKILEHKIGESLKIETSDGSVYVYNSDEILKITKDPVAATNSQRQPATAINMDGDLLTDVEGNVYRTVVINGKTWMAENLKTRHYADGTPVGRTEKGPNYYYMDDNYIAQYGILYNWAAAVRVSDNTTKYTFTGNRQGVCPDGWHVPTMVEFSEAVAGDTKSKAGCLDIWTRFKSTSGWSVGGNGTNISGFSALPAGSTGTAIGSISKIHGVGEHAFFWSATPSENKEAWMGKLIWAYGLSTKRDRSFGILREWTKSAGMSVRCVRD